MIGMLVSMIYNLTDTFWIGRLDNKSMTASVGVVFSFVSLVQALGFWFGYGSGNAMSRRLGERDEKEAEIISSTGIGLALGSGILLMLLSYVFVDPLAAFIGGAASDELLGYTVTYLKTVLISVPFSLYATTLYNQLRLCGNVKDGMFGLLAGMLSNIILDPVLILCFHMGVAGAGIATTAGQVIGAVYLTYLSFHHGNIPVSLRKFCIKEKRLYHILAGGAPNFSRQGITSIASLLLNQMAAGYGDSVIAGITISGRVAALAYLLMIGFGQGFQPICAMNYGAGKYDRVKEAFRLTVIMGTVFLVIASVVLAVFAPSLSGLFSTNSEVIEISAAIIRYQCISLPFLSFYAVSSMLMQNIGQYFKALWISVARQGIFFIPVIWILPDIMGTTGIYVSQTVADLMAFVFAVVILLFNYSKVFREG